AEARVARLMREPIAARSREPSRPGGARNREPACGGVRETTMFATSGGCPRDEAFSGAAPGSERPQVRFPPRERARETRPRRRPRAAPRDRAADPPLAADVMRPTQAPAAVRTRRS